MMLYTSRWVDIKKKGVRTMKSCLWLVLLVSVATNTAIADEVNLNEVDFDPSRVPNNLAEDAINFAASMFSGSAGDAFGKLSSAKLLTVKGATFEEPAFRLTIDVCSLRSKADGELYCLNNSEEYVVSNSCAGVCWRDKNDPSSLKPWSVRCTSTNAKQKKCKIVKEE